MNSTKFDGVLMDSAFLWSKLSSCRRRQVGCVIAKDSRILSTGYNGTISGTDNCCEYDSLVDCPTCVLSTLDTKFRNCPDCWGEEKIIIKKTKETVLHAEQNALMFALKQGISTKGATLYCTDAPCITCSKLIAQAGITKVCYNRKYHDTNGINLLISAGIEVRQLLKD